MNITSSSKQTYALLVFLSGASYGFIVPLVKYAGFLGLNVPDFLPIQYLLAFIIMAPVALLRQQTNVTLLQLARLTSLGLLGGGTSLCYYTALTLLPSAVALTLLFQFVWIGVVLECIVKRRLPARATLFAALIVIIGTLFAAGVFEENFADISLLGIICGLGSGLLYALFLFFSGRIETHCSVPLRTTMFCVGGFIISMIARPMCFVESALEPTIWLFSLGLAGLGIIIPVSLIAHASPHLNPAMVNIMASSELPMGIIAVWLLLGEQPTPLTIIGVVLILAGIAFNQLPGLRVRRTHNFAKPTECKPHSSAKK